MDKQTFIDISFDCLNPHLKIIEDFNYLNEKKILIRNLLYICISFSLLN